MVDRSDPVAVVDLATAIFHGNQLAPAVSLESQAGVRFRTPTAQWSFAVGFPINTVSEVVLEIDIEVYSGAIGLGVVNANLDAYESGEVTASPGRKTVALLAERGTAPSRQLVARNISTAGASEAAIISIRIAIFLLALCLRSR
jgi:hypothetical protein